MSVTAPSTLEVRREAIVIQHIEAENANAHGIDTRYEHSAGRDTRLVLPA